MRIEFALVTAARVIDLDSTMLIIPLVNPAARILPSLPQPTGVRSLAPDPDRIGEAGQPLWRRDDGNHAPARLPHRRTSSHRERILSVLAIESLPVVSHVAITVHSSDTLAVSVNYDQPSRRRRRYRAGMVDQRGPA
jgi:hypothetical protein